MRQIVIDGVTYGDERPFIIGEVGHNHGGVLGNAKRIVAAAKRSGASAVKFQTRIPKEVYQQNDKRGAYYFKSENPQWMHPVYGEHREALEFTVDEWKDLFAYCKTQGITAISTPFDFQSAFLLNELGVPAFKIASGDANNTPLLKSVARYGKPMIVSTGGCTMDDVQRIVATLESKVPFALLQCTCVYPATANTLNLKVIETYRKEFPDVVIGLSSHYPSWEVNLAAYTLGARIFENHFTVNRRWKGTDNPFSLTPKMMYQFIDGLRQVDAALGNGVKTVHQVEELPTLERRKSLVWRRDLEPGHLVDDTDLTVKCPGDGMEPWKWDRVVRKIVLRPVKAESIVTEADVDRT